MCDRAYIRKRRKFKVEEAAISAASVKHGSSQGRGQMLNLLMGMKPIPTELWCWRWACEKNNRGCPAFEKRTA